jgi:AAA domain-containing protein
VTLSLLLHAEAKVGKSTLSTTAPPPLCVFDAEGGWKFVREAGFKSGVPLRRREWDPIAGPPPRYDDTWDFCHVMVTNWKTLVTGYMWLTHTQEHDFRSIILDSITESQRRLKVSLKPDGRMATFLDWGDLLFHMDKLIRDMRDLVLLPKPNPIEFVMFIAETEMKDGKWRPAMQGQIGRALPYWVDICGYLFTEPVKDNAGAPTGDYMRKLLIAQGVAPTIIAGERVQGALPPIVDDPNITRMIATIFAPLGAEINQRIQAEARESKKTEVESTA